jgi:predicted kinase
VPDRKGDSRYAAADMFNVCHRCGQYSVDKVVTDEPVAICPECGHAHAFTRLPLLVVSGASGAGKSTVCHRLLGRVRQAVLLDSDILWRPEFNSPESGYAEFFETWLRLCKNIHQSGRSVVLFGAGFGVPANLETRAERRYLASIEYLALVCDDPVLAERLRTRPGWRHASDPGWVAEQQRFNKWFKDQDHGIPPIELVDTTHADEDTTTREVRAWIERRL